MALRNYFDLYRGLTLHRRVRVAGNFEFQDATFVLVLAYLEDHPRTCKWLITHGDRCCPLNRFCMFLYFFLIATVDWLVGFNQQKCWHCIIVGYNYLGGGFTYFLFSPRNLGKMNPFWRAYFSNGLVQPPTRLCNPVLQPVRQQDQAPQNDPNLLKFGSL